MYQGHKIVLDATQVCSKKAFSTHLKSKDRVRIFKDNFGFDKINSKQRAMRMRKRNVTKAVPHFSEL